jgi:uncharacterized repeat protein (TIGR01451 family)
MKSKLFRILAACLVLLLLAGTVYGKANLDSAPPPTGQGIVLEPKGATGPAYYIVHLAAPPLASYHGTIEGLAATNPAVRGQVKVDPTHPDAIAYRHYLETSQRQFVAAVEQLLGRSLTIGDSYQYAFNGLALLLTPEEAAEVAHLEGVRQLQRNFMRQPDTDSGPAFIGAPGIWDGTSTGGLPGTKGEGIIVGVIDTGINLDSPSFADIGGDGYNHTNPFGSGNYVGWCNPTHPNYDPSLVCNDKLIGVYSHTDSGLNPEDDNGHGSHTASTAAGNHLNAAVLVAPTIVFTRTISGVAPHANIIAYDACANSGCPLTALVEMIDQTIPDGVDILNYSFSTTAADPWNDSDSLALLGAFDAGIFASTSAGNSGPTAGTIGSPANAPWVTAAGASSHNRTFTASLTNLTGGNTTPPPNMTGRSITGAYGPAAIVYAGAAPYNNPFCAPFEGGNFTGQMVVCDNGGGIGRVEKGENVLAAGGGGLVLADNVAAAGLGSLPADPHVLPALHITSANGATLKSWLATGAGHQGRITAATLNVNPVHGGIMAAFSSRGPNLPVPDLLKPDVTNPGLSIYAAYRDPEDIYVLSGASMSSAHTAGAAALLRDLHPEWSAAELKSVLMSTAITAGLVKHDGLTPADPFDYGAGRVELTMAGEAGLVLDESGANMLAADPGEGGDPATLNLASLANDDCVLQCSWTRVVSSTVNSTVQWRASATEPFGAAITVQPTLFTLEPYDSQLITITANVVNAPYGDWLFGHVHLTPSAESGSAEAILFDNGPLVNYPGGNQNGYDVSAVQTVGLGMTSIGFNNDQVEGFRVADDFNVTSPTGWNIDEFTFYGYQTGSPITSTFTSLNYRVWDGVPGAPGSNIVFGDTATNRLVTSTWSEIYRTTETTVLTATDRPIMTNIASANFYLPPGTYWLDWQTTGSLSSGPWVPMVTIQGQETTGNALVAGNDGIWDPVLDSGTDTPQGFPFLIEGSVAASIDIAPVHLPLAVVPAGGYLPATIDIHTRRDAGSQLVEGLITAEITNLQVSTLGLSQGSITQQSLFEDPSNDDPFNNDGGTFYINVVVPTGSPQLIAAVTETTADDIDLYVGRDDDNNGPELSEVDCSSATSATLESCTIANPTAGTYWVLVQNWGASATPPDSVTLEAVAMTTASNLTVVGPASNPIGEPFDLRVYWNESALDAGEIWFGFITLGSDPSHPTNLGTIPIRLYRHENDVTKSVNESSPAANAVITYTVQVLPNITPVNLTYWLTDTLPAELTLVPGSASASAGTITESGNGVRWTGLMPAAGDIPVEITYQATVTGCGNAILNSLSHTVNNPGSQTVTVGQPIAVVCPPGVSLVKTLGIFPGECGTADSITLPLGNSGTWIVHCFTVTNSGGELFYSHALSDTLLGPLALPNAGLFDLQPTAVFSYTQVYTVAQFGLIESCGTWTATGVSGNVAATDCVTIEIVEATGVSLTSLTGSNLLARWPIMLAAGVLAIAAAALFYRRRPAWSHLRRPPSTGVK